jgi:hypothetical protein
MINLHPTPNSHSSSSSKVEREGERATTRQYDLRSVVPGNQHSGAEHHDPLPLHRFAGSDVPAGQYGEGESGVSYSKLYAAEAGLACKPDPGTRSARSAAENRVSEEANVSEANVKQSGRNYKVIRMKWNWNQATPSTSTKK